MNVFVLFVLIFGLCSAAENEVIVKAGHNNFRDALKANQKGTKYVLHPGIHSSETPLQPNEGDLIYGLPGAVIFVPEADCMQITKNGVKVHGVELGPCGGNGIVLQGVSDTEITDNYIHPEFTGDHCCDNGDGIFAQRAVNLVIQGNVIAFGEANIELQGSSSVSVVGNFFLNPQNRGGARGTQFQAWSGCRDVSVIDNYALSSKDPKYKYPALQEDAINFGPGNNYYASGNWIWGGFSPSGCGLIADDAANSSVFVNNTLYNTGQCGIGIADGVNLQVKGNRVLNLLPVKGGGNTALSIWKQYPGPCGPVVLSDNIAYGLKPDGSVSSYWSGGGCDPITGSGNIWDEAAYNLLNPILTKFPPPTQIPPRPFSCTVKSPFSANTRVAWC